MFDTYRYVYDLVVFCCIHPTRPQSYIPTYNLHWDESLKMEVHCYKSTKKQRVNCV